MTGKIIAIAQQKGGTGKTTLASHLAVAGATRKNPLSVAVLDTDPQGSLGQWYLRRVEHMGEEHCGLEFKTVSAWGAKLEAANLAKSHDLVIIDTPPKSDWDCRPAMDAADLVIVPVLPSPVDLWATEPTITTAGNQKTDALIVLNRVVAQAKLTGEIQEAASKIGAPVAAHQLGNRIAFASSMGSGATAIEISRLSKASKEARALADEVFARLFGG